MYSRADEALYLLGQNYEGQITRMRSAPTCDAHGLPRGCATEALKARYIGELDQECLGVLSKILTRYPMMDRSDDAKKRLAALHQPIPRPTKAAVAQNKAEIASRSEATTVQKMMGLLKKGPDVARAAQDRASRPWSIRTRGCHSGRPAETLGAAGVGEKGATVEIVKPNQPIGRSRRAAFGYDTGGSPFGSAPAAMLRRPARSQ